MHASTKKIELALRNMHKRASSNGRFLSNPAFWSVAQKREMAEGVPIIDR